MQQYTCIPHLCKYELVNHAMIISMNDEQIDENCKPTLTQTSPKKLEPSQAWLT